MVKSMNENIKLLVIDLFAGAGGVSTGFENNPNCKVIAAINHDEMAIASHEANHPDVFHFVEDIRHIQMETLQTIVNESRAKYPDALFLLWASLECTNFSKAKGGLPRDADSRSLADFMPWYVESLKPDYVGIENVIEFMSWGPLDENGKPHSKKEGCDYMRWVNDMKALNAGYDYDWRELNSADYGAYTSRKRFFAYFASKGLPIVWPQATHSKAARKKEMSLFDNLEPWKAVREVLDLEDRGNSIFGRKKPLSEKTLERIYAGLIKFVAGGKDAFLVKYNSMNQAGKYVAPDMEDPSPVISTQGRLGIVHTEFIAKYYSGRPEGKVTSTNDPAGTITTADHQSIVMPEFLASYYGNGDNLTDLKNPGPTLRTKDSVALIQPQFIYRDFGKETNQSIESPSGTITGSPKLNLVSTFLINPQWFNTAPGSVEEPCNTLIARMDKAPMSLVQIEEGGLYIQVYESDSAMTIKIKEFMAMYAIYDIKMRMLRVDELLNIQGFPKGYILKGNQTQQKKFIGNSVVPIVITRMAEALVQSFSKQIKVA
jgi:DNA (cytosine-5)-methyltransferase 1